MTRVWNWAACLAIVLLVAGPAPAQEKAFQVAGAGIAPDGIPLPGDDPRSHWSIGNATHLGRYYGTGTVETIGVTGVDPDTGIISGVFQSGTPFVFQGANGEQLACDYGHFSTDGGEKVGTFMLVPTGAQNEYVAFWVADFTPAAGSTGKFQGVTGGWTMYAQSEPFQLGGTDPVGYSWEGRAR